MLLSLLLNTALASSIASPAVVAGPDGGATSDDPTATYFNPAALGATEGINLFLDSQVALVGVTATTTRNGGIDPNTGEAYHPAEASVAVPVNLLGASFELVPKRLHVGIAIDQPFTGGGNYLKAEDNPPPYTSWTRYAGITTTILTLDTHLGVAVTPIDGVHVGVGGGYVVDHIAVLQASDPLGTEGRPLGEGEPYSFDSLLEGSATGGHLAWNAGLFFDRYKQVKVGASFARWGTFKAKGNGSVTLPEALQTESYTGPIPADITFTMPLPDVGRVWVSSEISDRLEIGAGWEYWYWHAAAGDRDGDIAITVKDQNPDDDNDNVGPDEGSATSVATELYIPRRLWSARGIAANGTFEIVPDTFAATLRLGMDQNAVPDFAVSATNLDFPLFYTIIGGRYQVNDNLELGLSYGHFFLQKREVTNSAWDVRDPDSEDYIDDHFSPKSPYVASNNGTFKAHTDTIGIRVAAHFGRDEDDE